MKAIKTAAAKRTKRLPARVQTKYQKGADLVPGHDVLPKYADAPEVPSPGRVFRGRRSVQV